LWRLNSVGINLITIEPPELGRKVEIADTEISLELFKRFRNNHINDLNLGPNDESPVNRIMPPDALAFCEWLGDRDGIPSKERCHARKPDSGLLDTVPGWTRKSGYRLMTVQEFEYAARAGTTTTRYPGDSRRFLDRYVQFAGSETPLVTVGVTDLKPNDLGFFGLLGNAADLVLDESETQADLRIRLGGGSSQNTEPNIRASCIKPGLGLNWIQQFVGFRVARTVSSKN
jgi:formylglycine-generating enzyme required for sulfatase activity